MNVTKKLQISCPSGSKTLTITGYLCVRCGRWHRNGSAVFGRHFDASFDANRKYRGNRS
jgi:DNA-directed RNA polymerase subunit RPC12/RpoP